MKVCLPFGLLGRVMAVGSRIALKLAVAIPAYARPAGLGPPTRALGRVRDPLFSVDRGLICPVLMVAYPLQIVSGRLKMRTGPHWPRHLNIIIDLVHIFVIADAITGANLMEAQAAVRERVTPPDSALLGSDDLSFSSVLHVVVRRTMHRLLLQSMASRLPHS